MRFATTEPGTRLGLNDHGRQPSRLRAGWVCRGLRDTERFSVGSGRGCVRVDPWTEATQGQDMIEVLVVAMAFGFIGLAVVIALVLILCPSWTRDRDRDEVRK